MWTGSLGKQQGHWVFIDLYWYISANANRYNIYIMQIGICKGWGDAKHGHNVPILACYCIIILKFFLKHFTSLTSLFASILSNNYLKFDFNDRCHDLSIGNLAANYNINLESEKGKKYIKQCQKSLLFYLSVSSEVCIPRLTKACWNKLWMKWDKSRPAVKSYYRFSHSMIIAM